MAEVIDFRVSGIPCKIAITYFNRVKPWKGSAHTCPSSDDYYGYTEANYIVLDRRGRAAPWLEKKVTPEIEREILGAIGEHCSERDI